MPEPVYTWQDVIAAMEAIHGPDDPKWRTAAPCGWTTEGTVRAIITRYRNHASICEACQDGRETPDAR